MISLRDRYTSIIFFCLSGIITCALALVFFKIPNRLVLNLDPRIAPALKSSIIDAYYQHHRAMPIFYSEVKSIIPNLVEIERYIKPTGTYLKMKMDAPSILLTPSKRVLCKSGVTIPATILSDEQLSLLEPLEIREDITEKTLPSIADFALHKVPLLSPHFQICWHNKTYITLTPYSFVNKHRYTVIIDHTYNLNTVLIALLQKFIVYHAELKKNQKTNNWIIDLRFDDWWIIHTRGLEGNYHESST